AQTQPPGGGAEWGDTGVCGSGGDSGPSGFLPRCALFPYCSLKRAKNPLTIIRHDRMQKHASPKQGFLMTRLLRLIWLLPLLLSLGFALAQDEPTFEPAPCPFNRPSGFSIQCGYVTVPESRDPALADDTDTIRLAVAIFQ